MTFLFISKFNIIKMEVLHNLLSRFKEISIKIPGDKSKQTMMNNTINEIKNSLEGINSRITEQKNG